MGQVVTTCTECAKMEREKRHIISVPRGAKPHEVYGTHIAHNEEAVTVSPYQPEQVAWLEQYEPINVREYDTWTYPGGQTVEITDYVQYMPVLTPIYSAHKLTLDEWLHSEEFMHDVHDIFVRCDVNGSGYLKWNTGEVRTFMDTIFADKGWPALPGDWDLYKLYCMYDLNQNARLELEEACYFAHAVVSIVYRSVY